jgi:hypothetical protein
VSWEKLGESVAEKLAATAVPALLGLAYKLLTRQPVTKDEVGRTLAGVAVDAGIENLAPYVTDAGAARAEEAVALAAAAVYGR